MIRLKREATLKAPGSTDILPDAVEIIDEWVLRD